MDEYLEKLKKLDDLARKTLTMSRNTLLVKLRFLDRALSMLELYPTIETTEATDGERLYYNPTHVLKRYKNEKEASVRDYLHIVLHCVFRHMYVHTLVDRNCWNLACDIAVEYTIHGLGLSSAKIAREVLQKDVFAALEKDGVMMTAEKLYRYYLDKKLSPVKLAELQGIFKADAHEPWYMSESERESLFGLSNGSEDCGSIMHISVSNGNAAGQNMQVASSAADTRLSSIASIKVNEQKWKDISEQIQMDMETFSRSQGLNPDGMMQNLKEVNREKYDYTAFLKKFAVMHEAMTVNDDEFDYIFYTYGLKLYKKVPLVEPLEYKDVKRIKEFVIAIDTSGSTSGELVQKFVQKTYNILKSTESFFSKINLHIIQCDATIQEDAVITTQEEFDRYIKNMTIHGLGGTDFRPVFSYVEWLQQKKEFLNLKGLIYFTDGWGTFPEKKPDFETAFVFIKDDYYNPEVPPWAIKLILQRDEV